VLHRLVGALSSAAGELGALFVQPPDGGEDIVLELLRRGFRLSHAGVAPSATMRVDLTRSHEELHASLNRRLRTWTRQWPRLGVRVRLGGEQDLPILVRLSALTARFQGFTPFPGSYLATAYRELAQRGHVVLLIGEVAGQPVAAELLTASGGVVKSRITGMDRDRADTTKLNVASAMIWEAICWGKTHGYRAFDFGGLRAESVQALRAPGQLDQGRLAKPDIFKTKFGGDLWLYPPAVELIRSPILRTGYDLLRRGSGGQRLVRFARERLRGTR
jgi:lipid II:glycine glycyltransferase (peptidoglycan interpeptide bridge formation enzyme)